MRPVRHFESRRFLLSSSLLALVLVPLIAFTGCGTEAAGGETGADGASLVDGGETGADGASLVDGGETGAEASTPPNCDDGKANTVDFYKSAYGCGHLVDSDPNDGESW